MTYNYKVQKKELLANDEGIQLILDTYDVARKLIKKAGCCTAGSVMDEMSGDTWSVMAALDFLAEAGKLEKILPYGEDTIGQQWVFFRC